MKWIGVCLAVTGGTALFGQRWLHAGATPDERQQLLPGDELLPAAQSVSTQAITVPGHLDAVWPWIAQMGYGGRAGFYSYPVLEWVGGGRHTRRIHGLPDPKPGNRIPYFTPQPLCRFSRCTTGAGRSWWPDCADAAVPARSWAGSP
jgi:hypothetical protein